MPTNSDEILLRNLFNALPESAVGGTDVSGYYVRRTDDPENDPVANLKQYIAWDDEEAGACYLFSGLRGSGKTTELNRLVGELRAEGTAAYYCDASEYLNLNDPRLTLPELLMAALAGLADAVRADLGNDFLTDSIWQRTKRLLKSNVELKPKLKMPVGGSGVEVEVEATLRENPDFRKQLVDFARSSSAFYEEAFRFSGEVAAAIRHGTPGRKIVLVVDSLERISAPSGDESVLFDSLKQVFFNEPVHLRFPGMSVIYSAPPYLHAVLPGVSGGFSQSVALPNFKVIKRSAGGARGERNPDGIARMVAIVDKRFADWRQAITGNVMEHLAWMSGGNVRRFFKLVRAVARKAALSQAGLPVSDTGSPPVRLALGEAAQPLQWLTASDRTWLRRFMDDSPGPAQHIEDLSRDLPTIIRLFDHSLVLDYQNGEVWYQVPEIVRAHV